MKPLTGFRDFYPDDCARRNHLFAAWRKVAGLYGFQEYDGPPLEELDLFRRKSGDEIVGQLYNFTDKGDREVALRPEMTPTLARMVAARHRDFRKPLRWFSIPQVFRYERPQKGRLREHFQLNCDIIGEAGDHADVELIALAIDILRELGLTSDDFVVRISDRQFWSDFLDAKGVPAGQRYPLLQAIDKSERQPREKTVAALGPLAADVFGILEHGAPSPRIDAVLAGLDARGLAGCAVKDLAIVRGLAYYTGIVFEVFDRTGENRAIAAGGRYDDLLANLGGVDLPALGFGMGDVVLGNLINERPAAKATMDDCLARHAGCDVFLVLAKEELRPEAMNLAHELRAREISVTYPLSPAKVGKQFQAAEQSGARLAVVIGDEWPLVAVKTLATREEQSLPAASLAAAVANTLS